MRKSDYLNSIRMRYLLLLYHTPSKTLYSLSTKTFDHPKTYLFHCWILTFISIYIPLRTNPILQYPNPTHCKHLTKDIYLFISNKKKHAKPLCWMWMWCASSADVGRRCNINHDLIKWWTLCAFIIDAVFDGCESRCWYWLRMHLAKGWLHILWANYIQTVG